MKRSSVALSATLALSALLGGWSCTKEKIVESTQYIKDVEYIQLPGDTVIEVRYIHDTVRVTDTVLLVDTVASNQSVPGPFLAIAAMQYYTDPLVLQFALQQFGLTDGWIFYLSSFQIGVIRVSPSTYDLYGYIEYWAPDWSGYYPFEYLWRLTYQSGDAALPTNWVMTDPPAAVVGVAPGLKWIPEFTRPLPDNR